MRPKNFTLLLLSLVCFGVIAMAQENPFLGKWDISGVGPHSNYVYWLEVKVEDGKISGSFLNRSGSVLPLDEIKIEGGELVFSPKRPRAEMPKQIHRAKIEEGRLLGMMTAAEGESAERVAWIGVRPPSWGDFNANKKYRMGAPVILFDGKTLEKWEVQHKDRESGWTIVDGAMTNDSKANNLVTPHRFRDFKIQCEYKLEEKSNSGIFLRGRYELQVLDDAGKPPDIHGHMALYSRVKPSVNASLPPGQWQTMEATIVGNRLTVVLNGKKVHDNIVIDGITGSALDSDEGEQGPIMIQGDHGKVWFRKIVVTPILNAR
jgi:mannose-6-phosphate isomerase-like protein (cupin superfamily)